MRLHWDTFPCDKKRRDPLWWVCYRRERSPHLHIAWDPSLDCKRNKTDVSQQSSPTDHHKLGLE
eukprot:4341217-Karenia_brevis.AAC.1